MKPDNLLKVPNPAVLPKDEGLRFLRAPFGARFVERSKILRAEEFK